MSDLWLPLNAIIADDANQPRTDELDDAYIEQLVAVPEVWPPIAVVQNSGQHILVDGFHRFEAAHRAGLGQICARVVEPPADGDLVCLGFELNAKHGRPLSLQDRRRHAAHLLTKDPRQSDRSISRTSGIAASTVASIRQQLESGAQIEQAAERIGSDGRAYIAPERKPGELPEPGLVQSLTDGVKGLLSSRERREMRDTARYLERLHTSLEDMQKLPGWTSPEDVAHACVETLGADKARAVALDFEPLVNELIEVIDAIASST